MRCYSKQNGFQHIKFTYVIIFGNEFFNLQNELLNVKINWYEPGPERLLFPALPKVVPYLPIELFDLGAHLI